MSRHKLARRVLATISADQVIHGTFRQKVKKIAVDQRRYERAQYLLGAIHATLRK